MVLSLCPVSEGGDERVGGSVQCVCSSAQQFLYPLFEGQGAGCVAFLLKV